ncbi:S41 family peptidase [Streptomyces fodineus]|uniref:S41 family peptidase n=1 Tax=Streptomyces fodineus TaxID=1904616 RepID=UPI001D053F0B|nr:S41 family peptidase [Streptomyces fodineus]
MEHSEIERIVAQVRELVATSYVFPDLGERIAADLGETAGTGRYASAASPAALANLVTEDLQRLSGDGHLRLIHHPEPIPDLPDEAASAVVFEQRSRITMSGIGRLERLDGNIGLLQIEPALFGAHLVGDDIAAAMRILRNTKALIIDLRACIGSDPATVAYFCSYLLPSGTHLNDVYDRTDDRTTQYWTLPHVPGPRYGTDRPVYVLTSRQTFSGGEELAYDLRHTGRAVIVGRNHRRRCPPPHRRAPPPPPRGRHPHLPFHQPRHRHRLGRHRRPTPHPNHRPERTRHRPRRRSRPHIGRRCPLKPTTSPVGALGGSVATFQPDTHPCHCPRRPHEVEPSGRENQESFHAR